MFTDELRHKVWDEVRQRDLRAFAKLLPAEVFVAAGQLAGVRLGRSALSLVQLVWLGIASAMHRTRSFASILTLCVQFLEDSGQWPPKALSPSQRRQGSGRKARGKRSKHSPYARRATQVTEEAFVQARARMPLSFWTALLMVLGERFEREHAEWTHWNEFRLLALDGTTIKMPKWKALREHFGTAKNGKSKGCTQARLVMLQLPLARLPWRYVVGPLERGERTLAAELLQHVSCRDLVLLDRGFWSYGLFHQIQDQGAYFAIRLPTHIRLRTLRRLGPRDRLVRWNMPTGPRWRKSGLAGHILLRVVDYQIRGFRPSAVVTNVLSPRKVSREDWVRLATETEAGAKRLDVGLYHRRWEIETTFFELKVTQGLEGSLRSRRPQGVHYEIAGHVLFYTLVRWLMVEAAVAASLDPLRLSFKAALEELCDMRYVLLAATPRHVRCVLLPRLLQRIASHLVPFRPGRHFPRPYDTKTKNCGRGKHKLPHKLKKAA
jgi:hypothetical protein